MISSVEMASYVSPSTLIVRHSELPHAALHGLRPVTAESHSSIGFPESQIRLD